jgi:phytoene dehydrogenase-like protein
LDKTDVIVVGGGHNGLVAASYLARAGLSVRLLEQRALTGGLTTTEEIFPGFWAEPASQIAHGIEPRIYRDMRLFDYGIEAVRPDPYLVMPFPGGRRFVGWRSKKRLQEEIRAFSEADAEAWFHFRDLMNEIAEDLGFSSLGPAPSVQEMLVRGQNTRHEEAFYKIIFGTTKDFFDERFESEEIKSALSLLATAFNLAGPYSSSPYMLLHWAFPRNAVQDLGDLSDLQFRGGTLRTKGGIGALTQAMTRSAEASGVEIVTGARVRQILIEDGAVVGVETAEGRRLLADYVISNVDPKATLVDLVGPEHLDEEFFGKVSALRRNGSACKFLMALDGVPRFAAADSDEENEAFLRSSFRFCPSMEYQERAFDDAKYGKPSTHPVIYGQCPTAIDPGLAPEGKHLLALTVFHAPYELREGTWEDVKKPYAEQIISTVEEYIPNIREVLQDWRLISPAELESTYGLPGGSPTHGEMSLPRLLGLWPRPNWVDHRTPVKGLYLCGSGTWPGGGVTGGPGYNGAHRLLSDAGISTASPDGEAGSESEGASRGW